MIENYEIKVINNEPVLYLYLDVKTEFAKINNKAKKTTLNKEIKNYCKNNNIDFKGTKIVLMVGTLLLGTILLKEPIKTYEDYNYTPNKIVLNTEINNKENTEDTSLEEVKEIVIEEPKKDENIANKENENKNNQTTTNNKPKEPIKTTTSTKPIQNTSNTETSNNQVEIKEEKPTSNALMVSVKRSNGEIINLELEEYLIGVVAAEMPASFHSEALKAQAIAARTYALKAIENGTTLTDTVSTQVYNDQNQLKAKWGASFNTYYNKVKNAVNSTKGLVMKYNNSLINAYYHSTSNGYTEDSSYVFKEYPYLKSVESPVDTNVSSYLRNVSFTYEEISNKLGIPVTSLSEISINKNASNRVSNITIDNNIYDGVKFRMTLGLRSTDFELQLNEDNVTITTRGYGHGVGMSQYGANEYAKSGWNYNSILTHYYTGITISHY
ncbi:MAG: stage II sporulation protein D [Ruminococcus sp.]|nr:stage II sporulation protein D [Ruminococcus sp.]